MSGLVYQLNVKSRTPGERGIPKRAVESVEVTVEGVVGDYNVYRSEKRNNDSNKAVMLMPWEMIQRFNEEDWPIEPGHMGENITTSGIPYDNFRIGDRYRVGEVEIQITEPCTPCVNLRVLPYVGEKIHEFMVYLLPEKDKTKNRRGWYAKVVVPGIIWQGDVVEKLSYSCKLYFR